MSWDGVRDNDSSWRARNVDPTSSLLSAKVIDAEEGVKVVTPGGRMHEALTKAADLEARHGYFWARGLSFDSRRDGHELGKRVSDLKRSGYVKVLRERGHFDAATNRHVDAMILDDKGRATLIALGRWEGL